MADDISTAAAEARSRVEEQSLQEQITKLQDDIKAIGASLAKLSDAKVSEARATARARYHTLKSSGQQVVDDLGEQVNAYEGQLAEAIRERPLTAVAGAIGIGYLIALLSRR
ncbi:MAG: DUF883 family protein [Devosia sp.]